MSLLPDSLQALVQEISKLPGVGERTALRYAVALLKSGKVHMGAFERALKGVQNDISFCPICYFWESSVGCSVCKDSQRSEETICIVRDCPDVLALEKFGRHTWRYHVLHGLLSPLSGVGPEELRFQSLFERLNEGACKEVILALDATIEGDATGLYLRDFLEKHFSSIKLTKAALGLPAGSSVEYLDPSTLEQAIHHRTEF